MNKPITILFGTRPEAIKVAPVILKLREKNIPVRVIHTGQHAELADEILRTFDIKPDLRLEMMKKSQTPIDLLQRLLKSLPEWISAEHTGVLLVQGDTTTALAGALTAHHQQVPLAHLEAGLRSGDRSQPFPEEANRTLISHLADAHFAPTASARKNLLAENISPESIHITGNSVVDALQMIVKRSGHSVSEIRGKYSAEKKKLILLTTHRRENFGEPLRQIFEAVSELASRYRDLKILFPAHPNPNVQDLLHLLDHQPSIELIKPLNYLEFVPLMAASDLILTDSGGIQEEAPALGTPVLVLRKKTERPELIESGAGKLIGTDKQKIIEATEFYLQTMNHTGPAEIFGDGNTAERVVQILKEMNR
ncbi:UDP-N-acetylglucosamine 2-epimerase (non-hydrolyzing) [Rhodohalobacter sp. SW132]|uniref:non-hydrolyzing UDP-N-acetylglucosamine 2-epimerase n=1 Tax=Rhodohalobacter sp. SW132 TaxID=2293433 RepID=UPI000E239C42|nr:UDP-N-acetylglucosamine 2-epimerase (non-hydrolyzing) [Rhodohalobacter sp. SW132]REL38273.1 UDP-N-acetylglucosamine 2-epimerase (non-hydrolyzing) [Rhodohalobacter sp. SW132]